MNKIDIEVAYAKAGSQKVIRLTVAPGTTVASAIQQSGILTLYPEIDLARQKVGVFSKSRELADLVAAGDRIEIYRPLIIDPKEARRAKARKAKKK